jgi:hypothetical protein
MKELENNQPSIFIISEKKQEIKKLQEKAIVKFSSQNERQYHLTHEINNIKNQDGRIYMKIDVNGNLIAQSISPYSKTFQENIEENIKPLIMALNNKRYLTYSSCEGHGISFRRYVGLAFADDISREYVANEIMKLNLPGVYVKYLNSVANNKIEITDKGIIKYKDKISAEEIEKRKYIDENEVINFNVQFHRNYDYYSFLEIVILKEVNAITYKNFIPSIYLIFLKKFFWNIITKKITNLIESKRFNKYKY